MEEGKIAGIGKKTFYLGLAFVVVAGVMFYAGAKYEKNKLSSLGLLKKASATKDPNAPKKQKKQKDDSQNTPATSDNSATPDNTGTTAPSSSSPSSANTTDNTNALGE